MVVRRKRKSMHVDIAFFEKVEQIRRDIKNKHGITISQRKATQLLSHNLRPPAIPSLIDRRKKNARSKKKKR